jgi:hypothetical protein
LSLSRAVHKLAALPAATLSLPERGRLRRGYFADVVVYALNIADRFSISTLIEVVAHACAVHSAAACRFARQGDQLVGQRREHTILLPGDLAMADWHTDQGESRPGAVPAGDAASADFRSAPPALV